ncbi:hypothetical protein [Stenotrophomonas sepilia]|uniref:hypothetical protein n=1 Tax=Stenotrophomonas sepilia TaxID=2860290 RepID=UPI002E7615A1|nr:hypothetical protein [Stenotrophomonas sepilia]
MEAIVAALAAVIALLAWRAQRTHNRLSVRPFPTIGLLSLGDRMKITVMNNGIGPMRILSLRFVDAEGASHANVLKVVSTKRGVGIVSMDDAAIAPNRRRTLFKLNHRPDTAHGEMDRTAQELARHKIVMEYTDVYGTKFPPYIRDLSFFLDDS